MKRELSPSKINLMLECPRCFWLHMVKGIKRPSGIFPSLPNGMDIMLKKHFDNFMERKELPPELKHEDCVNGCKLFDNMDKLKEWRNNRRGIKFLDKKSGILLMGAVDNIMVKGSKLIILDYKTRGFPLKEDTHKHYQTQMDLYNFLLRKNGYDTEDYAFLVFYYPKEVNREGEFIFETKIVKISTNSDNGEKVFRKAVSVMNMKDPPKPGKDCEFCKWLNKF